MHNFEKDVNLIRKWVGTIKRTHLGVEYNGGGFYDRFPDAPFYVFALFDSWWLYLNIFWISICHQPFNDEVLQF